MDQLVTTCTPHQPTLLGGAENMKLLFDDTMADLSAARKMAARHADAWESLRYTVASNAATAAHFINMGAALAGQVGVAEGQQTVSAVRTASGDNLAAGSAPANRVVDETGAVAAGAINSATAQATLNNVSAQLAELANLVATQTALLAQIVQNAAQAAKPGA